MPASIVQDVTFKAKPARIYDILLDSKSFSAATGGRAATIEPTEGGAFSTFGGMISGRTIELVPGKRIVQAWRVGNWPDGVYSVVRYDLASEGPGTRLTLTHCAFPEEHREHLASGWHAQYWEPLRAYLG